MLELIPTRDERIVAVRVDGKVSKEEFDAASAQIEAKLSQHDKLRSYTELASVSGMSLDVLMKDLGFSFKNVNHFDKAAIVTDLAWIRMLISMQDKLFPNLEVRAFPLAEKEAALDWLESAPWS